MIGKIKRVPLREVWKHEAQDFSRWLEGNLDVLSEAIGATLSNAEREKDAGDFSVDLVAEDEGGNPVIIENQLGKSDHDHLGKIVTYLTAIGAKAAIWIVPEARPEHVAAINWLNEGSSASFYLLKIEALQIDQSAPAPLLTLIVGPSQEGKTIGHRKKEMAERHVIRERFWTQLLQYAATKTKLHANISPTPYNWLGTGSGLRGVSYLYAINKHQAYAYLYVDRGKGSEEENLALYRQLEGAKQQIEKTFGGPLEWDQVSGRRACRILVTIKRGGYRDPEDAWPAIHAEMVDAMVRLEKAIAPHIKALKA